MALADTARLIASLELQDKFSRPAAGAERSLNNLDRKMSTLGASGQRLGAGLGRAFSSIARIGAGVAVGGIAALAVNIRAGVQSLNELESVVTQTETVIESTGGVAGQTAADIRALSEEYENLNATMDDKVIQTGANMLLTFTNIRTEAFEPALEAALDMNQAMGGGPEGLQSTAIRLGKALNDPIRGVGALARVGVTFTEQQRDQIEALVESNDLLGAQEIILGEVSREFGGQFAAAGGTAEGQMAKLGDTIEDLQQRLAGPLLPAIDRVRDRLTDFLGSRRAQDAAEDLGDAIAGIFTNQNIERGVGFLTESLDTITGFLEGDGQKDGGGLTNIASSIGTIATSVGGLPWESIGNAARLLGTGSKALLDAFLGLPPWVQTAVLTGWGLNKLTGGALGSIVSQLASGLIKGVLGINAGVVNINAGAVTGGGGGLPGGGRGVVGGVVGGLVAGVGVGLAAVAAVKVVEFAGDANAQAEDLRSSIEALPNQTAGELNDSLASIERAQAAATEDAASSIVTELFGVQYDLKTNKTELINTRNDLARNIVRGTDATTRSVDRVNSSVALERTAQQAIAAADAARIQRLTDSHNSANAYLQQIRDKRSSVNVTVNTDIGVQFSASATSIAVARYLDTTNTSLTLPDIT